MRPRDFTLLVLICLIWGVNTIVSKIVVSDLAIPPVFYTALRFGLVALATLPWLWPMPKPYGRLVAVALLMGGANFAFLFIALKTVPPSAAAIVSQAGVPFTTLLSIVMLGERIRWRRALGIAITLAGVLIVMWDPSGIALSLGLTLVLASAFAGSLGVILTKKMGSIAPLRLQAWVGMLSALPLALATALLEDGQATAAMAAGWPFVAITLYSALVVSVFAHTAFYGLIGRYEANLIAPLTLMTPLCTIALGVLLTGDRLDARMIAGSVLALTGVLIIVLRRPQVAPVAESGERG